MFWKERTKIFTRPQCKWRTRAVAWPQHVKWRVRTTIVFISSRTVCVGDHSPHSPTLIHMYKMKGLGVQLLSSCLYRLVLLLLLLNSDWRKGFWLGMLLSPPEPFLVTSAKSRCRGVFNESFEPGLQPVCACGFCTDGRCSFFFCVSLHSP